MILLVTIDLENESEKITMVTSVREIGTAKTDVLDIVDECLEEIFGVGKNKMIYYYIEKNSNLPREKIPENFDKFWESLRDLFGDGAEVIKRAIMRRLETEILTQREVTS